MQNLNTKYLNAIMMIMMNISKAVIIRWWCLMSMIVFTVLLFRLVSFCTKVIHPQFYSCMRAKHENLLSQYFSNYICLNIRKCRVFRHAFIHTNASVPSFPPCSTCWARSQPNPYLLNKPYLLMLCYLK